MPTPRNDTFLAGFALGERAVEAAHQSDLPTPLLDFIDGAPAYVEGRPVRMEAKNDTDVAIIRQLAAIKMAS